MVPARHAGNVFTLILTNPTLAIAKPYGSAERLRPVPAAIRGASQCEITVAIALHGPRFWCGECQNDFSPVEEAPGR